jgi:hypothetical protein
VWGGDRVVLLEIDQSMGALDDFEVGAVGFDFAKEFGRGKG